MKRLIRKLRWAMDKSKRQKPTRLVPHPRYGTAIIPSGHWVSEAEVRDSYWRYTSQEIFPETAIPADITRQNFCAIPRRYYVDILQKCRTCDRPFIFFAREQQHWYETLGFYIDADCVNCPECRRSDQQVRRRFRRYSEAVVRPKLDDKELETLLRDAVFLFRAGILRDHQRIRRLRNMGRRQLSECSALAEIETLVSELKDNPNAS